MRPKTRARQVIRYAHLNGTKNTPSASKCMIANGVTPTTEIRAPFGRGIDKDRAAVAMLGEFPKGKFGVRRRTTERFASDLEETQQHDSAYSVYGAPKQGSSKLWDRCRDRFICTKGQRIRAIAERHRKARDMLSFCQQTT